MPNWRNPEFNWDMGNIDHIIERHDVYPEEAEQVFHNGAHVRREGEVYHAFGQTNGGRYLHLIFELRRGAVRVFSARDMNQAERRRYARG